MDDPRWHPHPFLPQILALFSSLCTLRRGASLIEPVPAAAGCCDLSLEPWGVDARKEPIEARSL
jgi:hypothetical protein